MLRSFSTQGSFRGLSDKPFSNDQSGIVLGKNTLIYGQNGAGKTSLSELLRLDPASPELGDLRVKMNLRIEGNNRIFSPEAPDFPLGFAVYNRYYVENSLKLFLDGEGASEPIPVIRLGKKNVDIQNLIELLENLKVDRAGWQKRAKEIESSAVKDIKRLEDQVKANIIETLSPGAPEKYNTTTYRVTHVRKHLVSISESPVLGKEELDQETKIACQIEQKAVRLPGIFTDDPDRLSERVHAALTSKVESKIIDRLAADQIVADWVESGVNLHVPGDECKFCQDGIVREEILKTYTQHFSDALKALRATLQDLIQEMTRLESEREIWLSELPETSELLFEFQSRYADAYSEFSSSWEKVAANRSRVLTLLRKRLENPLVPIDTNTGLEVMIEIPDLSGIMTALDGNDAACENQSERKKSAQAAVEAHYASVYREEYDEQKSLQQRAVKAQSLLNNNLFKIQQELDDLKLELQDTGPMAKEIDSQLRFHFGHGHLSIAQSEDGKGYVVKRGNRIATDLSEGERNAIAYLYFLASLQADGVNKAKTVVVIDDPVTSLDRESMFAAFGLQSIQLADFAQNIFLTHDYEFFRLQVGALEGRYRKSLGKIRDGDESEVAFPNVSILEIKPTLLDGNTRISSLRKLSQELLLYASEYHYLFSKIAHALHAQSHDEFPLLGNAARRLIEGFAAFQAPHENSFGGRMNGIARQRNVDESLTQRVVKFMHGQSHRADPSPAAGLNFPSIEDELIAVIRFMREADPEHFDNMCKAVKIKASHLDFSQN